MKKRLFSILLSICMVFTMIPMAGGGVFAASTAGPHDISISNATYHENGALASIQTTFSWGGSTSAEAELVLMKEKLNGGEDYSYENLRDFSDAGNYGRRFSNFDEAKAYDEANGTFGFIKNSGLDDISYTGNSRTFALDNTDIPLNKDGYYYVYIWTLYYDHYYPDHIVCAISVKDGQVKYAPADGNGRNTFNKDSLYDVISQDSYTVTITPGEHMTKTSDSGNATQENLNKGMTPVVYTADAGYHFPSDYAVDTVKGIMVRRDSSRQITVYGTPSANAAIKLTDATEGILAENTITKPVAKTGLKYNGTKQTGVAAGDYYTLTGDKATNAGKHTATATLNSADYKWEDGTTDAAEIEWEIAQADKIKVTAEDKTAYAGDAVPENSYTVEGLFGEDKLGGEASYKYRLINEDETLGDETDAPDMDKEGRYQIRISALTAPAGGNYKGVEFAAGTLTITKKSSGGHYKPTQKPEIIAGEGSKADLTLNGTKATITVEEGYEITDVLVNGVSLGKVTEVTGLKTGDKVEIKTAAVFNIESYVKDLKLVARSSKTANKNVRVKVASVTDQNGNPVDLSELKDKGYTVKYKFYRSEKKSSEYGERLEKDIDNNSYLNNIGDKGTKYFYRVKVMVYDANGKLAAQTELNQCRYAVRTWSK